MLLHIEESITINAVAAPDRRRALVVGCIIKNMVVLEDLHKILAQADRVVVKDSPRTGAFTLFESTDKRDLDELLGELDPRDTCEVVSLHV